jgi:hypothetical protein
LYEVLLGSEMTSILPADFSMISSMTSDITHAKFDRSFHHINEWHGLEWIGVTF